MSKKTKKAERQKKLLTAAVEALPQHNEVPEFESFSGYGSMSFTHNGISVALHADDEHMNDMIDLYEHLKNHLLGGGPHEDDDLMNGGVFGYRPSEW